MSNDLEDKAIVALNLLKEGAEEVSIIGTDITVKRKVHPSENKGLLPGSQFVIVNNQASIDSKINIETHLSIVKEELRQLYRNGSEFQEIQKNLGAIEPELTRKNPNKPKLKEIPALADRFRW